MQVRKAIIPAAGWGTRLLPASKAIPKEMLPVVDRPGIQYIVEEAIASGLAEIILVTGKGKACIEDHFDIQRELEDVLEKNGRKELLATIREISRMVNIIAVRQKQQLGTGDAVLCAAPVAAGEAVAVLYPDDMIDAEVPVTRQLLDVYRRYSTSAVIALREVPDEDTQLYGIVEGERIEERLYLIKRIVEKPPRGKAPSNLAIIGRYILPPEMFPVLRQLRPSADGEIQLAEGLAELSRRGRALGYLFSGTRYDLGDKLGYVQATVGYALKRPELRERFRQWLREVVRDEK